MNQILKLIILISILSLPLGLIAQMDEIVIDWEKQCIFENKVKSMTTYHILNPNDSLNPDWRKFEYEIFDKSGNKVLWRLFTAPDTTKYSDREFKYNDNNQFYKMKNLYQDGTSDTDSSGFNEFGFLNYRIYYQDNDEVIMEMYWDIEMNTDNNPIKMVGKDKEGNILNRLEYSYLGNGKVQEKVLIDNNHSIHFKTLYKYHSNGLIKNITTTINNGQLKESSEFNTEGKIIVEIHYEERDKDEIDYKHTFQYDSQGREIEKITYSNYIDLRPQRREKTIYQDNCLKAETRVYSVDYLNGEEELYTIITYTYEYY